MLTRVHHTVPKSVETSYCAVPHPQASLEIQNCVRARSPTSFNATMTCNPEHPLYLFDEINAAILITLIPLGSRTAETIVHLSTRVHSVASTLTSAKETLQVRQTEPALASSKTSQSVASNESPLVVNNEIMMFVRSEYLLI